MFVDIEVASKGQLPYPIHTSSKSKNVVLDDRQVAQKWYPHLHRNSRWAISKLVRKFHFLESYGKELHSLHTRAAAMEKEYETFTGSLTSVSTLARDFIPAPDFLRKIKEKRNEMIKILKREYQVKFRMNKEEYEILKEKLEASGQTQQSFLINSIGSGIIVSKEEIEELRKLNRQFEDLIRQIKGMATNVNQMAYVANARGDLPKVFQLQELGQDIQIYRRECEERWQSIRRLISQQRHTGQ